jgi:pyrroline-5-carboxylate reductase
MIGCGFMGRAHSNVFHQAGCFFDLPYELKLRVVCARQRETVENFAARWGWEEAQTDWQSVVTRKDVDFLECLARQQTFQANFEDGVAVDRLLDSSAQSRSWTKLSAGTEPTSSVA